MAEGANIANDAAAMASVTNLRSAASFVWRPAPEVLGLFWVVSVKQIVFMVTIFPGRPQELTGTPIACVR